MILVVWELVASSYFCWTTAEREFPPAEYFHRLLLIVTYL